MEDYLKRLNTYCATSAKQVADLAESLENAKKNKKLEELNSPTNQHLKTLIQQNSDLLKQSEEQNKLLKEQNESLKQQLDNALENEKEAKKEARHNRIWVYISTGIAFASLIATILIAILK